MFTTSIHSIHYQASRVPGCVRTLAGAEPGADVELVEFLHRSVREACGELGLTEGAVVTCRDRAPKGVIVEGEGGRSLLVPWSHAHLLRVEVCGIEPEVAAPAGASRSARLRRRASRPGQVSSGR